MSGEEGFRGLGAPVSSAHPHHGLNPGVRLTPQEHNAGLMGPHGGVTDWAAILLGCDERPFLSQAHFGL